MRIDMVWSILRVVLEYKENSIFPVRRIGNSLNEPSEREIVVGHVCFGRGPSRTATRRVIAGQMHDLEVRQITVADKLLEFLQPHIDTNLIRNPHVECRILWT